MIERVNPNLSITRQCRLLSVGHSSFYYATKGESEANLALMRRLDALFLKYPFFGSRQMVRRLRGRSSCGSSSGAAVDAIDGTGSDLSGAENQ